MVRRPKWSSLKWARGVALVVSLLAIGASDAPAQDPVSAARDLQTSDDFRLRVSAALYLGRAHAPGAVTLLEQALGDAHPAVRTAAAAGLSALGDRSAVAVLQQKITSERSAGARSQMVSAIAALSAVPAEASGDDRWQGARYVVAMGDMRNRSGIPGEHASDVLRAATKSHAGAIPGALVSDRSDTATLRQAAARHLPVLMIDGALQRLSVGQQNAQASYNAQVDFSMRRVPEQQLRGMLSGSATSFGSVSSMHDPGIVTLLEDQAIDGAVESALRGAARGFGEALR
jgi:hypothetical protein